MTQIFHDVALVPIRVHRKKDKKTGKMKRVVKEGPVLHTFSYSDISGVPSLCEPEFRKFCSENGGWTDWRLKFRHEYDSEEYGEFPGWHPVPALKIDNTVPAAF